MKKIFSIIMLCIIGVAFIGSMLIAYHIDHKSEPSPLISQGTSLCVVNNTSDTIDAFLTLSVYTDTMAKYYIQNVNGIFGMDTTGTVGMFTIMPNDTVIYLNDTMALSGNICFGGQPTNCPTSIFPKGTNIFEFTINNQKCGLYQQESVEISCVAGVNSYMVGNLKGTGWIVTTGIDTVTTFSNNTLGNNTGRVGVFPTGCTNCTNHKGAPTCTQLEKPNDKPICIIQRPAIGAYGVLICTFNGYTK